MEDKKTNIENVSAMSGSQIDILKEKTSKKKRSPVKWIVAAAVVLIISAGVLVGFLVVHPSIVYSQAVQHLEAQEYSEAINCFEKVINKKDSAEKIKEAYYGYGKELVLSGKENEGIDMLEKADLPSSKKYIDYANAIITLKSNDYEKAIKQLTKIGDFEESKDYLNQAYYGQAEKLYKSGDYATAKISYQKTSGYDDVEKKIMDCDFDAAEKAYASGDLAEALESYKAFPENYEFKGIKVKNRLKTLKEYDFLVKMCGEYTIKNGNMKVTQTHNSTGIYNYWAVDYEEDDTSSVIPMTVKCILNDDGTFTILGTARFTSYTNYSSISSNLKYDEYTIDFKKTCTEMPTEIYNKDHVKITLNGSSFHLTYDNTVDNYSANFTYRFESYADFIKK